MGSTLSREPSKYQQLGKPMKMKYLFYFVLMLLLTNINWSYKSGERPQSIYHYGKELFVKDLNINGKKRFVKGLFPTNVVAIRGRDGTYDAILEHNEYKFDRKTDLLIHFNGWNNHPWQEYAAAKPKEEDDQDKPDPKYLLQKKRFSFSSKTKVFGRSSAKFARPNSTLLIRPNHGSLFRQTQATGSFTIEFWLNPSTLSNGEIIFKRYGPVVEKGKITKYSGIVCRIEDRRLKWSFHHIFHSLRWRNNHPVDFTQFIEVKGIKRLQRNQWVHHALSYNATTGKLTYFRNGDEKVSQFVTDTGQPGDTILTPRFYPQVRSMLTIGERYYGYMDEFMISRIAKTSRKNRIYAVGQDNGAKYFNIQKYTAFEGSIVSDVRDLEHTGSFLKKVKLNLEQNNGSLIILEYRMSNYPFDVVNATIPWLSLDTYHPSTRNHKATGRYFQWRAILKAGHQGKYTPMFKDISFHFEIDRQPSPPKNLLAYSSEGRVILKWLGNVEKDVNRYRIYYGIKTKNYIDQSDKPLPEGKTISDIKPIEIQVDQLSDPVRPNYILDKFSIDKVYYFVITAVDHNGHESEPSNEAYVRVRKEK